MTTDLIIFEENLTIEGLKNLQAQAETWPTRARDKSEYELVYSEHQRMKKLRQLVTKKKTELIKDEKISFENIKKKIDNDYITVMAFLEPIENKLAKARELWDAEIAAYKEKEAREEAEKQRREHERQQYINDWFAAHEENARREKEIAHREKQAAEGELKQIKECLSFDDAWLDAQEFLESTREERRKFVEELPVKPQSIKTELPGLTGNMVYPDSRTRTKLIDPYKKPICDTMSERSRVENIKRNAASLLNTMVSETSVEFKSDEIQNHVLNFITQIKRFIEFFPED